MKSKAAVIEELGAPFVVKEIEVADPIGAEVLVKTSAVGLCASDMHVAQDDYGFPLPAVFGHELAGVVTAVGPDVTEFQIGDRVVGSLVQFCGRCANCRRGRVHLCLRQEETLRAQGEPPRLTLDGEPLTQVFGLGAFSEYALVHQNQLVTPTVDVPAPQSALLGCSVLTGVGSVFNAARVQPGESVAVFGAGGVGLNVVSGAHLAGAAQIVVVDLSDEKLELSRTFGATDVVNSSSEDAVARIRELTGGGVDHAFEVIGLAVTQKQAMAATVPGGGAYFIGIVPPGRELPVDVFQDLLIKQARVQGVYLGASNTKHLIPMLAQFYGEGRLNLDDLISQTIALEDINAGYDALRSGTVARSVVTSF